MNSKSSDTSDPDLDILTNRKMIIFSPIGVTRGVWTRGSIQYFL